MSKSHISHISNPSPCEDTIVYRINAHDVIDYLNDSFANFSRSSQGPASQSVLGTRLWDHIEGQAVIQMYHALAEHVRLLKKPLAFDFRCDSPSMRRDMRMVMVPLPRNAIEFRATFHSATPHSLPPDFFPPNPDGTSAKTFLQMCAWCKSILIDDDWTEIEEALAASKVLAYQQPPFITHGICDACFRAMTDLIPVP